MGKKVLVVDDEKEIADLVEVYLKNDGYEVLKFYNATDALHCVMEEQEPDLALLDVMLPDMSGFTLCQKIREKYLFPIIMLTALSDEANQKMQTLWTDMKSSEEQTPNKVIVPAFMSVCVIASLIILIRRYIKKKKDMF